MVPEGNEWLKVADTGVISDNLVQGRNIMTDKLEFSRKDVSSLRLKIQHVDNIPEGHVNAGKNSKMRIDEIVVE